MTSATSVQSSSARRRFAVTLACIGLAFSLALASHGVSAQTVYRWVDDNGTVHYGERPPEGVEATAVNASPGSAGLVPQHTDSEQNGSGEPSYAQQQRDERAARAQAERERKQQVAALCEEQRALLARLEPRPKILVRDPDGTTRMLPDDERLQTIENARNFIRDNCE